MTERTIPILPCRSIDDVLAFYEALGFAVTYRQERPNTFAVVRARRDRAPILRHEGPAIPAASYSTCYVITSDVDGAVRRRSRQGIRDRTWARSRRAAVPRIGPLRETVATVSASSSSSTPAATTSGSASQWTCGRSRPRRPRDDWSAPSSPAVTLADSRSDDAGAANVLDRAFVDEPPTAGPIAVRAPGPAGRRRPPPWRRCGSSGPSGSGDGDRARRERFRPRPRTTFGARTSSQKP